MQYKLTVTYRQKHDSSDFPVDFAQSAVTCVKKQPHELLTAVSGEGGGGGGIIYKCKQCPKVPSVFGKAETNLSLIRLVSMKDLQGRKSQRQSVEDT